MNRMKNRNVIRKYTTILMFAILATVLLPKTLFANGAVIGYVWGNTYVSNAQLEKLTHVMVFDLYTDANGNLSPNPDWNSTWPSRLDSLVNRAHARGVKVSIVIGGGNFISATNSTYRSTLVAQIAAFVNQYKLDGVDINWEYPGLDSNWDSKPEPHQTNEWNQCIAFLTALKNHNALSCKRISMALSATDPGDTWMYPIQTPPTKPIPRQIWEVVDAIHLMTYDMRHFPNNSHSDATDAQNALKEWAIWGNSNGLGNSASREKLHLGCAFYGYNRDSNGKTLWNVPSKADPGVPNNPRVPYRNGGSTCGNPSDTPLSVAAKVNYCYGNNANNYVYGGVFFWELRYDYNVTDSRSLLKAIWDANTTAPNAGYPISITINTQPATSTIVVQGKISGSLSVVASTEKCIDYPFYQWYSNTSNSNTGGTKISTGTNASFTIPTNLTTGTYYYFCELKSGKSTVRSNVAVVSVIDISGPTVLCNGYTATYSILNLPPGSTVTWTRASHLDMTVNGNEATITNLSSNFFLSLPPELNSIEDNNNNNNPRSLFPKELPSLLNCDKTTGWVQAAISGTSIVLKKDLITGRICLQNEIMVWGTIPDQSGVHYTFNAGSYASITTWSWTPYENAYGHHIPTGFYLHVPQNSTVKVTASATNACGTVNHSFNLNGLGTPMLIFPNPASDIINIEFTEASISQNVINEATVTDDNIKKKDITYDLRLFSGQGILLRQATTKSGTVQFNVANLPAGIYYLHIYDGISDKPEIHQIMVER